MTIERKKQLRTIVLQILAGEEPYNQYADLASLVANVLHPVPQHPGSMFRDNQRLNEEDNTILLEVFHDLYIEKIITEGMDGANIHFPWFKLHSESPIKKTK